MQDRLAIYYRQLGVNGCSRWFDYPLMMLLVPLALVYGCISRVRVFMYHWGILPAHKVALPVISIGNLAVGGTGKTPMVSWLIELLHMHNYRVAVISRGYGSKCGSASDRQHVRVVDAELVQNSPHKAAVIYGDEPVLLARRHPEAIIVIAPQRAEGARYVQHENKADVIILDDGFQHLALRRDLDLVLLDARHPFGNGFPLPAGIMREFSSALKRSDVLLMTRANAHSPSFECFGKPVVHIGRCLADFALDLDGNRVELKTLAQLRVGAFAGIATPDDFFASLRKCGIQPAKTLSFADHSAYTENRVNAIVRCCEGCDVLLTTEKDGVKLKSAMFGIPCYQVPLLLDPAEHKVLENIVLDSVGHPE